jgi:hypothetical protein
MRSDPIGPPVRWLIRDGGSDRRSIAETSARESSAVGFIGIDIAMVSSVRSCRRSSVPIWCAAASATS